MTEMPAQRDILNSPRGVSARVQLLGYVSAPKLPTGASRSGSLLVVDEGGDRDDRRE